MIGAALLALVSRVIGWIRAIPPGVIVYTLVALSLVATIAITGTRYSLLRARLAEATAEAAAQRAARESVEAELARLASTLQALRTAQRDAIARAAALERRLAQQTREFAALARTAREARTKSLDPDRAECEAINAVLEQLRQRLEREQ